MSTLQAVPREGTAMGIDIGGSGIKGAPVDLQTGELLKERVRIPTPQPATPEAVAEAVGEVTRSFDWTGPLGCTVPAVVQHGVAHSAANIDKSWIGTDVVGLVTKSTGASPVFAVNDADAAGFAEVAYGAARGRGGVVLVVTLGTGIGSALIVDGVLVPNTELGHLELDGKDAEKRAADSAREREELSWKDWGKRLQRYFAHLEALFSPDLFVVGGGVSKKSEKFLPLLDLKAEIVPAGLLNNAGIAGAALLAAASA
jgi:polyphosphate glucokinase